jgi:hypothetical protein
MIVPAYWAEARVQQRAGDRQVTVRRFGWSDAGQDDAQAMADARAAEAMQRIVSGEPMPKRELTREPKVPYNGAAGVPIREEITGRQGSVVVTRNSYGARCLNVPDVLIADIDFVQPSTWKAGLVVLAVLALASIGAGLAQGSWLFGGLLLSVSLVAFSPIAGLLLRLRQRMRGGPEAMALHRVERFLAANPAWNLRTYRTPAGLRVIATHRTFDPADPEALKFFRAVAADPVYVRMCLNQRCFRARVTAKPWRIGIEDHLRPRPGVWPVDPLRLPVRTAWIEAYEAKAAAFAACRYVTTVGSGVTDPVVEAVIALHDDLSRANTQGLPIA